MHDGSYSIAETLELLQYYIKPSIHVAAETITFEKWYTASYQWLQSLLVEFVAVIFRSIIQKRQICVGMRRMPRAHMVSAKPKRPKFEFAYICVYLSFDIFSIRGQFAAFSSRCYCVCACLLLFQVVSKHA